MKQPQMLVRWKCHLYALGEIQKDLIHLRGKPSKEVLKYQEEMIEMRFTIHSLIRKCKGGRKFLEEINLGPFSTKGMREWRRKKKEEKE